MPTTFDSELLLLEEHLNDATATSCLLGAAEKMDPSQPGHDMRDQASKVIETT